ncbi:MAG: hypothetical protein H7296_04710 [Bacteroidia bacterium]|nr:hypothetical protein [Bacteroidia bacterium]
MLNLLQQYFIERETDTIITVKRKWDFFESTLSHLHLLAWAFKEGNAHINLTVSRLALPIIIRNVFNRNKTIIVWHYFDKNDGKSNALKIYYQLLFFILKLMPAKKVALITVAAFWEKFFCDQKGIKPSFLFPNFLDAEYYHYFKCSPKLNTIHLGQYSFKNDPAIFELSKQLMEAGYTCYFSTNNVEEAKTEKYFSIIYFEHFKDYVHKMAQSQYTLALTIINEGWNRVAHESLLSGTHVIGYCNGGLGDLLSGSNSIIVKNCSEVLAHIKNNKKPDINYEFLNKFNKVKAIDYLQPIIQFITG